MRLFNALLASILFPMISRMRTLILIPYFTVYFITASIHNAIGMYRERGIFAAVAAFTFTLLGLALPALNICLLIATYVYLINILLVFEFIKLTFWIKIGFMEGWNGDGFVAFSHLKTQLKELVSVFDLRELFQGRVLVSPIIPLVIDMYRDEQPLDALVADRASAFASLQIDQIQWENLQATQAPRLTQDEIARLESMGDQPAALGFYKDLLRRLEKNDCPILLARPEKKEAVLLTKQYQNQDKTWLPVPNRSEVYDKESLQSALAIHGHMSHPTSRDPISTPSAYDQYPDAPTRYVWHKYYVNESAVSGISQELSGHAQELRGRLDSTQPGPSKTEQTRSARPAFFEGKKSHVNLDDDARKTTSSCM